MAGTQDDLRLWDEAAARYDEIVGSEGDWRRKYVLDPALASLIGEVAGQNVLDAGCGQGWVTRWLIARGARVVGVDGSDSMLALARKHLTGTDAQFLRADLCQPLPFPDHSFDLVVSAMVLMDMPEVPVALGEFYRVLRPEGRLVIAILHPCFPGLWTKDESGKPLWKSVADYFTIRVEMLDFWGPTRHYHRPLSYYFQALTAAGFVVDALVEPTPAIPWSERMEHTWRVPDFVLLRGRKAEQ